MAKEIRELRQQVLEQSKALSAEIKEKYDQLQVIDFLRDAAVLIADSQFDIAEYETRRGWGHTCADDTVDLAIRAGVKQLFLFHHDPDHDDEKIDAMVARGAEKACEKGSALKVAAAREGAEYAL